MVALDVERWLLVAGARLLDVGVTWAFDRDELVALVGELDLLDLGVSFATTFFFYTTFLDLDALLDTTDLDLLRSWLATVGFLV